MNLENSQNYYGTVLTGSNDLLTDACTMADAPKAHIRGALGNVHEEVKSRYYGCGLVAPQLIEGAKILDLGSGSGQDAYVLAQLVATADSADRLELLLGQRRLRTKGRWQFHSSCRLPA